MKGALFGSLQVNIHVPNDLKERFSKFFPLFIMDTIPKEAIPRHMKEYQERTGQKTIPGTRKLLGIMSTKKAFTVCAPVAVVPQPQPENNCHS